MTLRSLDQAIEHIYCFCHSRSLGYSPFSEDSDFLLMSEGKTDNPQPSSASQTLSSEDFLDPNDQFSLAVSVGGGLGEQAVSPLPQNNQEHFRSFNSLDMVDMVDMVDSVDMVDMVDSVDKAPVVEVTGPQAAAEQSAATRQFAALLASLSEAEHAAFIRAFSALEPAQQRYAYAQFVSSSARVQQFALGQFLSLSPAVLAISINRELESEPGTSDNTVQPQQSRINNVPVPNNVIGGLSEKRPRNILGQIINRNNQQQLFDQSRFQTNFVNL